MSFELLSSVTPWLVAFALVAFVGVALAVGVLAEVVVRNRQVRLSRGESLRTYYAHHLALTH